MEYEWIEENNIENKEIMKRKKRRENKANFLSILEN